MRQITGQLLALLAVLGVGAGISRAESAGKVEQSVVVHFDYGAQDWSTFFQWEQELRDAITAAKVGKYDGNELSVAGIDGSMYIYGPDADKLFAFVKPRLLAAPFLNNITVTLRYGDVMDPSARKTKIELRR
jgi:hypothetical protein